MKSQQIKQNVQQLIDKFGDRVKSDKHLLLAYWSQVDGVNIDKSHISVTDFMNIATPPNEILDARMMIEIEKAYK